MSEGREFLKYQYVPVPTPVSVSGSSPHPHTPVDLGWVDPTVTTPTETWAVSLVSGTHPLHEGYRGGPLSWRVPFLPVPVTPPYPSLSRPPYPSLPLPPYPSLSQPLLVPVTPLTRPCHSPYPSLSPPCPSLSTTLPVPVTPPERPRVLDVKGLPFLAGTCGAEGPFPSPPRRADFSRRIV